MYLFITQLNINNNINHGYLNIHNNSFLRMLKNRVFLINILTIRL